MTRKPALTLAACALLLAALTGVDSCGGDSKPVEITFLHTNDIHLHLKAEASHSEKNPYNLGGVARLKTLVDRLRAAKPNTLVLDGGDWSEGNAYYNVDAGSNMLRILDAIGYNAVVVGNHDHLNGPSHLASAVERANPSFPVLGANKNLTAVPDKERVARKIPDYAILEVGGVKVGVIGLLTDEPTYAEYFKPAVITNAPETAARLAKKLHEEKLADVIVLLSHNSFDLNKHWAKNVPFVNLIVSGHKHYKTIRPYETTNAGRPAYVVEAGEWGQFLGELTLSVDKEKGQATLKSFTLHPVTSDIPEDPKIAAMVREQDELLKSRFGRDVVHEHAGTCAEEFARHDEKELPLSNAIADAYRASAKTQMALESVQLVGVGLHTGPFTVYDALSAAPHIFAPTPGKPFPEFGQVWTVKKLTIRGNQLRAMMNVVLLADAYGVPLGWVSLSGARIHYSRNAGASPIQRFDVLNETNGEYEALVDERMYTVAIHDGLLLVLNEVIGLFKKLGFNLDIDFSDLVDTGIETNASFLALVTAKASLRAADFDTGVRYRTVEADLALLEHGVQVKKRLDGKGYVVNVAVQNDGLAASNAGAHKLTLRRSPPNDPVNDQPGGSETILVAKDVAIPALGPGDRTIVELPWTDVPAAGVYGLEATFSGADGNDVNNLVRVHTRVEAVKR